MNTEDTVEVENISKRAKPKRARYHSGMIDMNTLESEQDFERLPETYVIWITERNDKLNKEKYTNKHCHIWLQ